MKKGILYLNIVLFLVVSLLGVYTFIPSGRNLIQSALAQLPGTIGEGTVNYLARFTGAQGTTSNTIGSSAMFQDTNGNVGIGTETPRQGMGGSALDVGGVISIRSGANIGTTDFTTAPWTTGNGGVIGWNKTNAQGEMSFVALGGGSDGGFSFYNLNTQLVRILRNGNVGIGTGVPSGRLDIANGLDGIVIGQVNGDNTATIQTYIDTGAGGGWGNWAYAGGCCHPLLLQPYGGNVGIGVTAPTQKFEVGGNIHLPNNASMIVFPEISGNTGFSGLMMNIGSGYLPDGVPWYGAGREPGAWVHPYPDFVISNHTGIRLVAHGDYGGVSIYQNLGPCGVWSAWSSTGCEIARFKADVYGGITFSASVRFVPQGQPTVLLDGTMWMVP